MSKPLKRSRTRIKVAQDALEACEADLSPAHISRLEDALEGVYALRDGVRRELGNAPTARERRDASAQA